MLTSTITRASAAANGEESVRALKENLVAVRSDDRDRAGVASNLGDDARRGGVAAVDRCGDERSRRRGEHGVAESRRTVRLRRGDERLHQRRSRAGDHVDVRRTGDIEHAARVAHHRLEARVSRRAGGDEQLGVG